MDSGHYWARWRGLDGLSGGAALGADLLADLDFRQPLGQHSHASGSRTLGAPPPSADAGANSRQESARVPAPVTRLVCHPCHL